MSKFNEYIIRAENENGNTIIESKVTALGLEQAFHKAVSAAFEATEPGTGERPESICIWRVPSPSEHQG